VSGRRPALPEGLRWCETCGEPRGMTPTGAVSACPCQGVRCNWCGTNLRRPISDHWCPEERRWIHVPYFGIMGHACQVPPERRTQPRFTSLPRDPDLRAYQDRVTAMVWAEVEERARRREEEGG
jgi:hypothetical protein